MSQPKFKPKQSSGRVRMPSAASIVARSYPDRIIGIDNTLPWHLRTDLQLFKKRTSGHVVIMGRKTFESIGKPLPNRKNIVLARTRPGFLDEFPSVQWADSPETAIYLADVDSIISGNMEFFIIGGEQIYRTFHTLMNRIFVTDVYCGNINGDAKFDVDFDVDSNVPRNERSKRSEWLIVAEDEFPKTEHDEYPFRVTEYRRRVPTHRYRVKEEFMGRVPDMDKYWQLHVDRVGVHEDDGQLSLLD